jgi:DNA-binding Lrp family transcriptional regulator
MELDRYDRAILRLLQQDARITNTLLAGKVSLSESACGACARSRNPDSSRATPR